MHSYLIYLSDDIMVMVKRRLSLEFGTWRFAKGNNARGFAVAITHGCDDKEGRKKKSS